MPGITRDDLDEASGAASGRPRELDPLLPELGDLPEGCAQPLTANGRLGDLAGFAGPDLGDGGEVRADAAAARTGSGGGHGRTPGPVA